MNILTRISLTIFLLLMAAVYLPIGLWAIIAPAQDALGLELPSFYEAVGLSVISPIGYSEFAFLLSYACGGQLANYRMCLSEILSCFS